MRDTAARLLLSPLLAAQAIWVIARALRLPEAAGPRAGTLGAGPPLRLHIIGDSSAAGVGVAHQDAALLGQLVGQLAPHHTVHWTLQAKTGATTRSTLATLADDPPAPADIVILILGVNDTTRLTPIRTWQARQRRLMAHIRTLHSPDLIYVTGLPPMGQFRFLPHPLRWTLGRHAAALDAARMADLRSQPDAIPVPVDVDLDPQPDLTAADNFHPSAKLYTLWATEMASRILSDWPLSTSR